VLSMTNDMC